MGLRETFQKAAATGFKVAGNVVKRCVYFSVTDDGIDPRTEMSKPVGILFGGYSLIPAEGKPWEAASGHNIQTGNVVGTIRAVELDPIIPKAGDYITMPGGKIMHVLDYRVDSAGAMYKVSFREP